MTGAEYVAFLGASMVLAVTPGPDTFLMLRFGAHNVRAGLVYTTAVALGVMVWAILALTGVAALLEQFPGVRTALTWVGGSYLMYLGISALFHVQRRRKLSTAAPGPTADGEVPSAVLAEEADRTAGDSSKFHRANADSGPIAADGTVVVDSHDTRQAPGSVFRTGLISSLTNPKTGLFFLALLPPFLPQSPSLIDHGVLVATVAACILVYGALLSAVADRIGRLLTVGSGPIIIDAVAGAVLIGLGLTIVFL